MKMPVQQAFSRSANVCRIAGIAKQWSDPYINQIIDRQQDRGNCEAMERFVYQSIKLMNIRIAGIAKQWSDPNINY